MASPQQRIKKFLKDEEGATAVEYAIMIGFIAAVIIASVAAIGTDIKNFFVNFGERLFS